MQSPAQARAYWPRAASLVLVALLHLFLLLLALQIVSRPGVRARLGHELTFILPPLPKKARSPDATPRSRVTVPATTPRPLSLAPPPFAPQAEPTPNIGGFGQSLFGCAPETMAGLSPDQRRPCVPGFTKPDETVMTEPPSHVKDPARRAAEMAAKNRPFAIPCAIVMAAPAPYGGTKPLAGFDPVCALKGLMQGFGPPSGLEH